MKFIYTARDRQGKVQTGSVQANSKEAALSVLQKYDFFITSLYELKEKQPFFQRNIFLPKPSKKELASFFRQLSVMVDAHVPVVQSLSGLAAETQNKYLKKVLLKIALQMEEGFAFSQSLTAYPELFPKFYINLIHSGEESGNIAATLYSISSHLEKEHDMVSQLRQALIYPLFLLVVLCFVVFIVIWQIVPKIEDLLDATGSKLPPFAAGMVGMYKFLGKYWIYVILLMILSVALFMVYVRSREGKKEIDEKSLKIPFVKDFLKNMFLVRFANNVSTLLTAGISIDRALSITKDAIGNHVYKSVIDDILQKVSEGEKLSLAMGRHKEYFSSFVLSIIKVGEATGKLDKTLLDIVSFYEKEMKRSVDLFSRLLEPVMIVILGVVITIIAISVLSSIYGAVNVI